MKRLVFCLAGLVVLVGVEQASATVVSWGDNSYSQGVIEQLCKQPQRAVG